MKTHHNRAMAFLAAALATAVAVGIPASSASAAPAWHFGGTTSFSEETIQGDATGSSLTVTGLTTTCEHFLYSMKVRNIGGTGEGEVVYAPIFGCSTNTVCTVEVIEAVNLPWSTSLVSAGGSNYVVLHGVQINVRYDNPLCALYETELEFEGTAGGRYDNLSETITFNSASFAATGTQLTTFGVEVKWSAVFSAEAFGPHLGQAITVS